MGKSTKKVENARPRNSKVADRFWSKVNKTKGCWLWTAGISSTGYGAFHENRKPISAHRFSWKLNVGPIPKGLFVLHKCDNRRCVRPSHLFLGTMQDNEDDMVRKRRHIHGTRHHKAKLTEHQVREIRCLGNKNSKKELGIRYGVSATAIGYILSGRNWRLLE